MAALFNDGSNSIKQTVQLDDGSFGTAERTEEWYDVDGTYRVIKDGMYKRVALQFPDWLLCDSPRVVAAIIARDPEWFRPEEVMRRYLSSEILRTVRAASTRLQLSTTRPI